jgi:probable selenium-dependent hydroxylase accessory protein YqeC
MKRDLDDPGEWTGTLPEALGLRPREMVCMVGGGGKTTLMFRLARDLASYGKKVITTTTTRILEPLAGETEALLIDDDECRLRKQVEAAFKVHRHVTVAAGLQSGGKLRGIAPGLAPILWRDGPCDDVLIEADGAACRPVKAPREHEPVIPEGTTLVVGMMGLDGLGEALDEEHVFQPERVSRLTGVSLGKRLTPEGLTLLATHEEGLLKSVPPSARVVVFLNKLDLLCDGEDAKRMAREIIGQSHPLIDRVILGSLQSVRPVFRVYDRLN